MDGVTFGRSGLYGVAWLAWSAISHQLRARLGRSLMSMNALLLLLGRVALVTGVAAYSRHTFPWTICRSVGRRVIVTAVFICVYMCVFVFHFSLLILCLYGSLFFVTDVRAALPLSFCSYRALFLSSCIVSVLGKINIWYDMMWTWRILLSPVSNCDHSESNNNWSHRVLKSKSSPSKSKSKSSKIWTEVALYQVQVTQPSLRKNRDKPEFIGKLRPFATLTSGDSKPLQSYCGVWCIAYRNLSSQ